MLQSPYDWYVRDASGSPASTQLCVSPSSDPDGDAVQYLFQVLNQIGDPVQDSGWITSPCYSPTLGPGIYGWKVKTGNNNGALASDWSQQTWHFSVASGEVAIGDISFRTFESDQNHMCVNVTFGGIIAPDVYAWLNRNADGSESGEWRLLDHFGPNAEDCRDSAQQHGFRIYPREYVTGHHAVKITAIKRDADHNLVSSASRTSSTDIAYLRPPDPQPLSPSTGEHNGTFWNTLAIPFQWTGVLRADQYQLRASANVDLWNDSSPLANVSLPGATTSYTATFTQDYGRVYWNVKAINSAGYSFIYTPPWFGIDRVAPTCAVQALPTTTYDTSFPVTWGGSDNAAGIRSYDIQSRDSRTGGWSDWLTNVPVTTTYKSFGGLSGHAYGFRCRATDAAGVTGAYPASADASTTINPAARPQTPWWNSAYGGKYNILILNNMPSTTLPAGYPVLLHFDNSTPTRASDIYNASQSSPKCNDLRIVANDTTELDRLVENCTSSAIDIRFRTQVDIAGGPSNNTTHQMYYGNPSPGSPPASRNAVRYPVIDASTSRAYEMRECSGSTLHDSSGNGDATFSSSQMGWTTAGKFGCAVLFPGDGGPEPRPAVDDGANNTPTGAFTVEFWYKRAAQSGVIAHQTVHGHNSRWSLTWDSDYLSLTIWPTMDGISGPGATTVRSNRAVNDPTYFNYFHHYAVTFDGGTTVRFYIDGQLDSVHNMRDTGLKASGSPLRIGASDVNTSRLNGQMSGFALSNVARTDLSYGRFGLITTDPTLTVSLVARPATGSRDLAVLGVNTYPDPDGGTLVQAVVQNQGNLTTQDGFYIDLYRDHRPSGANDLSGSIRYWEAAPLDAGATITVTAAISNPVSSSGVGLQSVRSASDVMGTVYVQADSTGVVPETNKSNNVSSGSSTCLSGGDPFETDNAAGTARAISSDGTAQTHNLQAPGDQDWASLAATQGATYIISTANVGTNADTLLSLYGTDGQTVLGTNDDYVGLASQLVWQAPASGTYFVKVTNWDSTVGGCGTYYDLSVLALANEEPSPSPSPSPEPTGPPVASPSPSPSPSPTATPVPSPTGSPAPSPSPSPSPSADTTAPSVTLHSPAGGQRWAVGSRQYITWTATDDVGVTSISLYVSTVGGNWTTIATGEANDGAFSWAVPNAVSGTSLVQVVAYDAAGNSEQATSGYFTIFRIPSDVRASIDNPIQNATVLGRIEVRGWAADLGSIEGTGVDAVHVYLGGPSGVNLLGVATYGSSRADVAAYLGSSRFTRSGFTFSWDTRGLSEGPYSLYVYVNSTVSGWSHKVVPVSISHQSNLRAWVDTPGQNAQVAGSVEIKGWAADANASEGTGVDAVHVYAQGPAGLRGLGQATYGYSRPDVAAALGSSRFTGSGFSFTWDIAAESEGPQTLFVYIHSLVSGWTYEAVPVYVSKRSDVHAWVDSPRQDAALAGSVEIRGWAADLGSTSGTGIDAVHVYIDGPAGQGNWLGVATYGYSRADVASALGSSRFTGSGFSFTWDTNGVSEGTHNLYVYMRSTVSGWTYTTVPVRVSRQSDVRSWIDRPAQNSSVSGNVQISGWAADLGSSAGTGIDAVHVYLDGPVGQGTLLDVATYGYSRPDVAAALGSSTFTGSGFSFTWNTSGVSEGVHNLYVYMHSTLSGWSYRTVPVVRTTRA